MTTSPVADHHPFDVDTRVTAVDAEGEYAAQLSERWLALGGVVNGGYAVAVCLSALAKQLSPPDPLAVSTFFARRASPGPAQVHVDVLHEGRRLSIGSARLVQAGIEVVRTTATFADLGGVGVGVGVGSDTVVIRPPLLPPPEQCVDPARGAVVSGATMTGQVEFRYTSMPGWRIGAPSGASEAEFWIRFAGGRDADTRSLPLLVDAAAPVVLELGAAGSATLELTTHVRCRPSPGWLACRVATQAVIGGYHEESLELWDGEGRLVADARQLAVVLRPQ